MTEEVRIARELVDEVLFHCLRGRPDEACGILAARDGEIVKVFRMRNAAASPVRYTLDPKEQLAVYNEIDGQGWDLGGVFHSHTRTEAYPSPTDVRLAAVDVPYVIVSLAADPPVLRGFRIIKENWMDERGTVVEVPVVVTQEGRSSVEGRSSRLGG